MAGRRPMSALLTSHITAALSVPAISLGARWKQFLIPPPTHTCPILTSIAHARPRRPSSIPILTSHHTPSPFPSPPVTTDTSHPFSTMSPSFSASSALLRSVVCCWLLVWSLGLVTLCAGQTQTYPACTANTLSTYKYGRQHVHQPHARQPVVHVQWTRPNSVRRGHQAVHSRPGYLRLRALLARRVLCDRLHSQPEQ